MQKNKKGEFNQKPKENQRRLIIWENLKKKLNLLIKFERNDEETKIPKIAKLENKKIW